MAVQIVKLLDSLSPLIVTGGLVPRGAYNAGTTYAVGDSVSYNGSSYICILASTGNLPTNTTYWQVVANKGDTGATGAPGTNGTNGLDVTWLGAYNAGTLYVINDAVEYNGAAYICKLASTGNLPTNTTYWDLMAQKGVDGTNGTDGLSVTWEGTYVGGTSYVVNDAVAYNGSSYICKLASTGNLPTNTTYWDLMAQQGSGGGSLTVTTVSTASYTSSTTTGEEVILSTYSAGNCIINLPTAIGNTAKIDIRKTNTSAYLTIIDGNGTETINGSATKEIQYQNTSVTLVSDGSNWFII